MSISPTLTPRQVDTLIAILPAVPSQSPLISKETIYALGPDDMIVNVARGNVMDEDALIRALGEGRLLAAGLDVYLDEPNIDRLLLALPNVVLTPSRSTVNWSLFVVITDDYDVSGYRHATTRRGTQDACAGQIESGKRGARPVSAVQEVLGELMTP